MKKILPIILLGLMTQISFASDDEIMNFLNEKQGLNLAIPADHTIESMQVVVADKGDSTVTSTDTINKNIMFSHGSPMVGFAGMTPYDAVRIDNLVYDREGDGTTVCTTAHQKLINGELNHKDLSDFACHSVVATALGVTVSNAVYKEMRDRGIDKTSAKAVSYLSSAVAGVAAMTIKEKVYDRVYETADIGTGLVPLYESDEGFGVYYIGDLYKRKSIFMVVHFQ